MRLLWYIGLATLLILGIPGGKVFAQDPTPETPVWGKHCPTGSLCIPEGETLEAVIRTIEARKKLYWEVHRQNNDELDAAEFFVRYFAPVLEKAQIAGDFQTALALTAEFAKAKEPVDTLLAFINLLDSPKKAERLSGYQLNAGEFAALHRGTKVSGTEALRILSKMLPDAADKDSLGLDKKEGVDLIAGFMKLNDPRKAYEIFREEILRGKEWAFNFQALTGLITSLQDRLDVAEPVEITLPESLVRKRIDKSVREKVERNLEQTAFEKDRKEAAAQPPEKTIDTKNTPIELDLEEITSTTKSPGQPNAFSESKVQTEIYEYNQKDRKHRAAMWAQSLPYYKDLKAMLGFLGEIKNPFTGGAIFLPAELIQSLVVDLSPPGAQEPSDAAKKALVALTIHSIVASDTTLLAIPPTEIKAHLESLVDRIKSAADPIEDALRSWELAYYIRNPRNGLGLGPKETKTLHEVYLKKSEKDPDFLEKHRNTFFAELGNQTNPDLFPEERVKHALQAADKATALAPNTSSELYTRSPKRHQEQHPFVVVKDESPSEDSNDPPKKEYAPLPEFPPPVVRANQPKEEVEDVEDSHEPGNGTALALIGGGGAVGAFGIAYGMAKRRGPSCRTYMRRLTRLRTNDWDRLIWRGDTQALSTSADRLLLRHGGQDYTDTPRMTEAWLDIDRFFQDLEDQGVVVERPTLPFARRNAPVRYIPGNGIDSNPRLVVPELVGSHRLWDHTINRRENGTTTDQLRRDQLQSALTALEGIRSIDQPQSPLSIRNGFRSVGVEDKWIANGVPLDYALSKYKPKDRVAIVRELLTTPHHRERMLKDETKLIDLLISIRSDGNLVAELSEGAFRKYDSSLVGILLSDQRVPNHTAETILHILAENTHAITFSRAKNILRAANGSAIVADLKGLLANAYSNNSTNPARYYREAIDYLDHGDPNVRDFARMVTERIPPIALEAKPLHDQAKRVTKAIAAIEQIRQEGDSSPREYQEAEFAWLQDPKVPTTQKIDYIRLFVSDPQFASLVRSVHQSQREKVSKGIASKTNAMVLLEVASNRGYKNQYFAQLSPESFGFEKITVTGGGITFRPPGGDPDAKHLIVEESFEIGTTPVTNAQYLLYLVAERRSHPFSSSVGHPPNEPVTGVTQVAAKHYAVWLSSKDPNYNYRLPTEAELRFATSAGTSTRYYFGDNPKALHDHGWFQTNSNKHAHDVAQLRPNPNGLYDLYGNVTVWTTHLEDITIGNRSAGDHALSVGTHFNDNPELLADDARYHPPEQPSDTIGFRLVRTRK